MKEIDYEQAIVYTRKDGKKLYVFTKDWDYRLTEKKEKATIFNKNGWENYKGVCDYLNEKNKDLIFAIEQA